MANNGESAAGFVKEADTAREGIKRTEQTLSTLFRDRDYVEEAKLLKAFHSQFVAYEVLDRSILKLALEKTNAQATRLSFGSAASAAEAFKSALSAVAQPAGRGDSGRVRALTAEVTLAVREIQVLEAPHIAEPNDAVMTQLEEKMKVAEARAQAGLAELATVLGRDALAPADAALTSFLTTHAQIVALSRRNTELRSLAMTLGEKRALVAACQESLHALAQTLTKRLSRPTR